MLDRFGKRRLGRTLTGLGVALTLVWGASIAFNASGWYDGLMVYIGHGQLKIARYWSPTPFATAREIRVGVSSSPGVQFWYPVEFGVPAPPPPSLPPPPSTPPTTSPTPAGGAPAPQVAGQMSVTLAPSAPWSFGVIRRESINGFGIRSEAVLVLVWPWSLMALAAGVWLWRRNRGRPEGCRGCGYPRGGLPAGDPCPECGLKAPAT